MKKIIIYSILVGLIVGSVPANAAVKTGSKCKTVGVTKFKKNKEFICTNKGKKLVWKKNKKKITIVSEPSSSETTSSSETASASGPIIAMSAVEKNNSAVSCWSVIGEVVYDLTKWIDQHPGSAGAILSLCGIDGTNAFYGQHGAEKRPNKQLAGFELGTLE